MKEVKVKLGFLENIYDVLCSSSKIDWDDRVTSKLRRLIKKTKREERV